MYNVISSVQPAGEIAADAGRAASGIWFDAIFREHYPRVVALLSRLTGDRAQAEEIAADVFCKVSQRGNAGGREDPAPWLYRVATNAGLDALRSNTRRRQARRSGRGRRRFAPRRRENALDDVLREERCARVREVLERLKPRDAQLLLLRAEGLAYRELAEALGMQPGSVGTLLARAEAEFEKRFRARYGDRLMKECWTEGDLRAYLDRELARGGSGPGGGASGACGQCDLRYREIAQRAERVADALGALVPGIAPARPAAVGPLIVWPRWAAAVTIAAGLALLLLAPEAEAPGDTRPSRSAKADFVALDNEPIDAGLVVRVSLGPNQLQADVII